MKTLIGVVALVAATAALSACGTKRDPNMPTAEDNAQLNDAARMLDSVNAPAANDEDRLGNGDEAVAEDSDGEDAGNASGNGQ